MVVHSLQGHCHVLVCLCLCVGLCASSTRVRKSEEVKTNKKRNTPRPRAKRTMNILSPATGIRQHLTSTNFATDRRPPNGHQTSSSHQMMGLVQWNAKVRPIIWKRGTQRTGRRKHGSLWDNHGHFLMAFDHGD